MSISTTGRQLSGVIAVIAWCALALQLLVTVSNMTAGGASPAAALWRYLGYFTILTNLLVAITTTCVARSARPSGSTASAATITGVVLAIAIVGVVYEVLLSGRVPEMGPVWWTADRLLHYVVPSFTVLWWLLFVPKQTLTFGDPPRWLIYPVAYLVYALIRGGFDGWYPYYFVDASAIGYSRALINAALLTVATLVLGYLLVAAVKLTRAR